MTVVCCGENRHSQLSGDPEGKQPIVLAIDGFNVACIAAGWSQTVIVDKAGGATALGNDTSYMIGTSDRGRLTSPVKVALDDELFIWAHCTQFETGYLTINGEVIVCSEKNPGTPIHVSMPRPAVFLSGSYAELCAIDNAGAVYMFLFDPLEPPIRHELMKPCYDVARGDGFAIAIGVDGTAFGNGLLNDGQEEFARIPSLRTEKILRCFAYFKHAAVITTDYRVLMWGSNSKGQLGRGRKEYFNDFGEVPALENQFVIDVALGYEHSLFLTSTGAVFGCGANKFGQLFSEKAKRVYIPTKATQLAENVSNLFCGDKFSFALCDAEQIVHPGMAAMDINMPKNYTRRTMNRDSAARTRDTRYSSRKSTSRSTRF